MANRRWIVVKAIVATAVFNVIVNTCALVTSAVRYDVTQGSLTSMSGLRSTFGWLAALPAKRLRRGLSLGAIAVVVLAPALILALAVCGFPDLTQTQFILCQTVFAVALGILVTPLIALYAMADPPGGG